MITRLSGFRRDNSIFDYGFVMLENAVFAFKKLNANKVRSRVGSRRFCIAVLEIPKNTWIGTGSLSSVIQGYSELPSQVEQLPDLRGREIDTSLFHGKCRAEQVIVKGFVPTLNRSFPEGKKALKYAYSAPGGRKGIRYAVGEVIKPLNRENNFLPGKDEFFEPYTCSAGIHFFFKIDEANNYDFW